MTAMTIGAYLTRRLAQAGVTHLFGSSLALPAFAAEAAHNGILWTGLSGEAAAAQAAEGYALAGGRIAALATSAEGGLSALGVLSAARAARAPIVHIVETGDDDGLAPAFRAVTVAWASLEPATAAAEIDRVLGLAATARGPVHLGLTPEVASRTIDGAGLASPLPAPRREPSSSRTTGAPDTKVENTAVENDHGLWGRLRGLLDPGSTLVVDAALDASDGLSDPVDLPPGTALVRPTTGSPSLVPAAWGAGCARPTGRLVVVGGADSIRLGAADLAGLLAAVPAVTVILVGGADDPWTWELVPAALGGDRARVFSVASDLDLDEAVAAAAAGPRPVFVRIASGIGSLAVSNARA